MLKSNDDQSSEGRNVEQTSSQSTVNLFSSSGANKTKTEDQKSIIDSSKSVGLIQTQIIYINSFSSKLLYNFLPILVSTCHLLRIYLY